MKQCYFVFLFVSMILLSVNSSNALNGAYDEQRRIDQIDIDKLIEKNRECLKTHDFDSIILTLPDDLLFDICSETKEYGRWICLKAHSLIMLDRKNEACELMEKAVLYQMDKVKLAALIFTKVCIDCLNDNYGNATLSISKTIELIESLESDDIDDLNEDELDDIEMFTFMCYQTRAAIYAIRRMHKETEGDLMRMQEIRRQSPNSFHPDTPGEYLLRKYLEDPEDKAFHRVEMPSAKADPSEISFMVHWWCCGLSEETKIEYFRLFVQEEWMKEYLSRPSDGNKEDSK